MNRVVVAGSGGSGKTVFATRLAAVLAAPIVHLDAMYYDESWTPCPPGEFASLQESMAASDRWVADGNYVSTLPIRLARADTVVFLDIAPLVCLVGILRRRLRHRGGQDPGRGIFDRITPGFLWYVLTYRRRMRPRVLAAIGASGTSVRLVTLRSRRAAARYLATIAASRPAS